MPHDTLAGYNAPNGDTWLLRRDREFGQHVILWIPKGAAADQCISFEVDAFERRFRDTPQYVELRRQVRAYRGLPRMPKGPKGS
jgi:hypothetical protein